MLLKNVVKLVVWLFLVHQTMHVYSNPPRYLVPVLFILINNASDINRPELILPLGH